MSYFISVGLPPKPDTSPPDCVKAPKDPKSQK